MDDRVLRELSPLLDNDFMYVADRRKKEFTYPIHRHDVFELNYIENGEGVLRIVGDSSETIGKRELVLITGSDLEHVWLQGTCHSDEIREITVQFYFDFDSEESIFSRTPMLPIKRLFEKARKGVAFSMEAIDKVFPLLDTLSTHEDKFYSAIKFLSVLYEPTARASLQHHRLQKWMWTATVVVYLKLKTTLTNTCPRKFVLPCLLNLLACLHRRSAVFSSCARARR